MFPDVSDLALYLIVKKLNHFPGSFSANHVMKLLVYKTAPSPLPLDI